MTKERFIQLMRSKRGRWMRLLRDVASSDVGQPGADGIWSIRDLIIHVTAYERGLVEWLEAARLGDVKEFPILDHEDVDYRNLKILEQKSEQTAGEATEEAIDVFDRLMDLIEATSEEELLDPDKTEWYVKPRWKQSRALWECIADDSIRHYDQHLGNVEVWLSSRRCT